MLQPRDRVAGSVRSGGSLLPRPAGYRSPPRGGPADAARALAESAEGPSIGASASSLRPDSEQHYSTAGEMANDASSFTGPPQRGRNGRYLTLSDGRWSKVDAQNVSNRHDAGEHRRRI
ncbi:MAG: hypothetical protein NVS3B26_25530 [Mycobacteriales bacterium]